MIRTKNRMRLCLCLLIANLAFIWGNSLLPAEVSKAFSDWVHGLLSQVLPGGSGGGTGGSGLLRKLAHFAEFCALGFLLGWLFGMLRRGTLRPFLWGVAVACADEALQFLAPQRGPGIRDVCIDAAGVAAGILLLLFGHSLWKKVNSSIQSGGTTK